MVKPLLISAWDRKVTGVALEFKSELSVSFVDFEETVSIPEQFKFASLSFSDAFYRLILMTDDQV